MTIYSGCFTECKFFPDDYDYYYYYDYAETGGGEGRQRENFFAIGESIDHPIRSIDHRSVSGTELLFTWLAKLILVVVYFCPTLFFLSFYLSCFNAHKFIV